MININKEGLTNSLVGFIKSDWGLALAIVLIWKTMMLLAGYVIDSCLNGANPSLLHHTTMWDAGWYATVINDRYQTNAASAAFYPLFPFIVALVHTASLHLIDVATAGQVTNTLCIWLIVAALLSLGKELLGTRKRSWLIILVLSSPAAFFMHVFYGEALFIALGFWAYLFALRRQWLYMGTALALLTATRLPSLLFIGLCGLEFMRAYKWKMKKIFNKNLLYFFLAPIGFITYGIYLFVERGDFLAMFHAYQATNDWPYQVFDLNIIKTVLRIVHELLRVGIGERTFDADILVNHLLPIVALAGLGLGSLYLIWQKGKYIPLGIFGLIAIVMFTLNSNVVSVHRYVLPCLTIYVALTLIIRGKYQNAILACIGTLCIGLQLLLFSLFINNVFAG